eukprot:2927457-Prymnesium_polylepis.1
MLWHVGTGLMGSDKSTEKSKSSWSWYLEMDNWSVATRQGCAVFFHTRHAADPASGRASPSRSASCVSKFPRALADGRKNRYPCAVGDRFSAPPRRRLTGRAPSAQGLRPFGLAWRFCGARCPPRSDR